MIDVIIPYFNSSKTILACMDSVLNQTLDQSEYKCYLVNDGSCDNTSDIVDSFISKNSLGNSWFNIQKSNGGASSARNFGISVSSSKWVAFLDSDDSWMPDKLELQLKYAELKSIRFLGCFAKGYHLFVPSRILPNIFIYPKFLFYIKWFPFTPSVFIDRSIFDDSGVFDEMLSHGEDCDLWSRVLDFTDLFVLNKELVVLCPDKHVYGDSGLSSDLRKMLDGEFMIINNAVKRGSISFIAYRFLSLYFYLRYIKRKLFVLLFM